MAIELLVEKTDPAAEDLFGFCGRVGLSGGDGLGLGGRHIGMDDKPRGLDAARVIRNCEVYPEGAVSSQ